MRRVTSGSDGRGIDWRQHVRARLPRLRVRAERENEIVDELALQLEAAYEDALARGASPQEARRQAQSEVPDWHALASTLTEIEQPEGRGAVMTGFQSELWQSARHLMRTPVHTGVAVVTLALGLGLGTAAFSLINGVLLRPLPYPAAERLVLINATVPPEGRTTAEITLPDAIDLASAGVFDGLAAIMPYAATATISDPPSRVEGFEVSASLFTTLQVTAARGRLLDARDAAASGGVVIGHSWWQRLGAPEDIIGRSLTLDDQPYTIVGVAPAGFAIDVLRHPADVFVPITPQHPFANNRGLRAFRVIARLRDEVSLERANAAAATIGARLATAYPSTNRDRTFMVRSLRDEVVGPVRGQLWLIAGLVALVLLVAAVNFTGLLLTSALARGRDVALRLALGASRWRIVRTSLSEGLWLTIAGAALGLLVARGALDALRSIPGLDLPRLSSVAIDGPAFAALAITAIAIAGIAALLPLMLMRHLHATAALRSGHETTGRPAMRVRTALIVGQTSFVFLLVAAVTLLATSLYGVLRQPLGFATDDVVTMRIAVPPARYQTRTDTTQFFTELLDRLREHPSVRHAGLISNLPLAGSTGSTLTIQGKEDIPLALRPTVGWQWTSPGYFAAVGMPMVRGRDFTADDVTRAPHVTVINETLARLHFGGEDPIGKRVYFGGYGPSGPPEWHEVIGVVGDVRHRQLETAPDARAYDLFGQHWGRTVSLAVRTSAAASETAGVVRRLLAERDPRLAVFAIRTTADLVTGATATRRLLLLLVAFFATTALVIALIGLYGTLSYMVAQRTREIGVRIALGATRGEVRRLVVAYGMRLAGIGVGIGLVGVFVLRQAIESQLFGISAVNPLALVAAGGVLLATAVVAALVPASRAAGISPVNALRAE